MCTAKRHVRFTPESDRKSGHSLASPARQPSGSPISLDRQKKPPPLTSKTATKPCCGCSGLIRAARPCENDWSFCVQRTLVGRGGYCGNRLDCSHNAPTTQHAGRKIVRFRSVGESGERILVPQPRVHQLSEPLQLFGPAQPISRDVDRCSRNAPTSRASGGSTTTADDCQAIAMARSLFHCGRVVPRSAVAGGQTGATAA